MTAHGGSHADVLVCMSASPSSRHVIKAASEMLKIPGTSGIALYVGSPAAESENAVLKENIAYARECGFEYCSLTSNNLALSIAEFATRVQARDLFIGSTPQSTFIQNKKPLSEQLTASLSGVNIHIIPDALSSPIPSMQAQRGSFGLAAAECGKVILIMSLATFVSFVFYRSRYSNANIITIYILAVLIASLVTTRRRYGILAAVLYILLFNFLFIEPRFTLLVYDSAYLMTYFVSLLAALITSSLAAEAQAIARRSAENAWQARVLLDTSNQLEQASSSDDMIEITCRQLLRLLNRSVLYYPPDDSAPGFWPAGSEQITMFENEQEKKAAAWARENRHHCGAHTATLSSCRCQYFSIHTDKGFYGVIGIDMKDRPFSGFEVTILHSILHETAMALENEKMRLEHHKSEMEAQNERLRSALLRSISHDLRTPLTAIYGNAANLMENADLMSQEDKREVYDDIRENSGWLVRQMENILSMTKLETDPRISITAENVEDVILESVRHLGTHPERKIVLNLPEEPLFALMDPRLIVQVLDNLLNNAMKYTPPGSSVYISAGVNDGKVRISVGDEGSGIPEEDREHIFDLFWTGRREGSDSSRSMGIGLNLCQMIMKAHHSVIEVTDRQPRGAEFSIYLQAKEIVYE